MVNNERSKYMLSQVDVVSYFQFTTIPKLLFYFIALFLIFFWFFFFFFFVPLVISCACLCIVSMISFFFQESHADRLNLSAGNTENAGNAGNL